MSVLPTLRSAKHTAGPTSTFVARGGLRRRYTLLIIALVALLLVVTGTLTLTYTYRQSLGHLRELQAEQAAGAAARIEQYIDAIEQQLGWPALAGMDPLGDSVARRHVEYIKLLRLVPAITEAFWIDADGREQLRVSRLRMDAQGEGVDRSAEPLFALAKGDRVWRSPVSFRKETEPYMTIARHAGLGDGGGVVVVEVNLKFVWDVVASIHPGGDGIAYVVDANGALIAHPDISLVLKQTSMAALPQVAAVLEDDRGSSAAGDGLSIAVEDPIESGNRGAEAFDLAGSPVLSAWATVRPLGWRLFVESQRSSAMRSVWDGLQQLGLALVFGLAVAAFASITLARRMVQPIRALQEGARRVAAGDLGHRIDAVGDDELQTLAEDFNGMAADLQASYRDLERKVEARTAELSQALAHQTATAEVLQVISSSVANEQPVYQKILACTCHIFGSGETAIFRAPGDGLLHLVAATGELAERLPALYPMPMAESTGAMVIEQRRQVYLPDVLDPAVDVPTSLRKVAYAMGNFSIVLTPLLLRGAGIGLFEVRRAPGLKFTDKELALMRTFADQAVIAIENARLVHELENKSQELEAASRHKSEFLASMSHELRTPLNAIIGFSEVLVERMFGDLNAKQAEYLQDIHASGQHLLSLINDVLDLSKIEAGRMELEPEAVDLVELLDSALNLMSERAERQGLTLAADIETGIETWVLDGRKIKQVLLNLLSNAIKFTPGGGQVEVQVRRTPEGPLEISVTDTGIGIAVHDQARIFEEFQQAGGSFLRKSEGTGLGLAVARRFVELHGGRIDLHSVLGQGSTFSITLPARELGSL